MESKFALDGQEVTADKLATFDTLSGANLCRILYVPLKDWPAGQHHLIKTTSFNKVIMMAPMIMPQVTMLATLPLTSSRNHNQE